MSADGLDYEKPPYGKTHTEALLSLLCFVWATCKRPAAYSMSQLISSGASSSTFGVRRSLRKYFRTVA